jgi:hypothetical protein
MLWTKIFSQKEKNKNSEIKKKVMTDERSHNVLNIWYKNL